MEKAEALPLVDKTPLRWGRSVLEDPIALLIDHAFLEKKAAMNAMELMTRWPTEWFEGWVETMTRIARDEASHLAQVANLLIRRGGKLARAHKSEYANQLRTLVRKGDSREIIDRLLVSALIEARSCERFAVLATVARDEELSAFYKALFNSEFGHYKTFLRTATKINNAKPVNERWKELLEAESVVIGRQPVTCGIHSGVPASG